MKYTQKNKKELLVFSIILAGLIFLPQEKATINWIPPQTEENVYIGTSKVINAVFKSTKELENVKFWLTPRLSKYTKIQPENIAKIEKDKEYNISIIVSIPTDFRTKKYEKDNLKDSLKTYLNEDFDEKEYKQDFKDQEEFFKDFNLDKIQGLLFVAEEKQTKWPNFIKQKRTVRRVYPLPLKITVNVKKATAEEIPQEMTLPSSDRIMQDSAVGQDYIKDEIIVKFKEGVSEETIKQTIQSINGVFIGFFEPLTIYQVQVRVVNFAELDQKVNQLEQNPNVEYAGRQILTLPSF